MTTTLKTTTRIGPTGDVTLRLPSVPDLANIEVEVLVILNSIIPTPPPQNGNGHNGEGTLATHIDRFAGSMPDFPDIDRPGPESYEKRLQLDE